MGAGKRHGSGARTRGAAENEDGWRRGYVSACAGQAARKPGARVTADERRREDRKTARRAWEGCDFGICKTNYVVKTTEFGEKPRGGRGNGVFSEFTKRITLLKQRNSEENRAAGVGMGCFRDSQNELRC